ncbi:hypothetical protein JCM15765_13530 [Paradesulfitobacterium aromaticivorans]
MNLVISKKEIQENVLAWKGKLWFVIVALLFSTMAYSFVGVKELSLLAQTEMMVTFGEVILGLGLIISIILAAVSFSSEKEQSTLESILLTPVARIHLAWGKLVAVLLMWFLTFILAIPYIVVLGRGTHMIVPMLAFLFVVGSGVVFLFACISMGLSIVLGSSKSAIMTSLMVFMLLSVPALLSSAATKAGVGAFIAHISPAANAMNLLKGIILHNQGIMASLAMAVPIFAGIIVAYGCLLYALKKLEFEGGE